VVKNKKLDKKLNIKVTRSGPYFVSGGIPLIGQRIVLDVKGQCLTWKETITYPDRQTYSLCRCGRSKNKPFCDSIHEDIQFDGTETASHKDYRDQCRKFTGSNLDLTDAKALCAHIGFCDREGGTWDLVSHSDNPKSRKIAIEESCDCPSGRLIVWDKKGQEIEPIFEPSIAVVESPAGELLGPFWVRGGIPIESANGEIYEIRNRVTLCGCGKSSNKPFCDGSHRQKK
jgi:CDGSH-type Zn-finger protein